MRHFLRAVLLVGIVPTWAGGQACTKAQAMEKEVRWVVEPEQGFDTDVPQLRRRYLTLAATSDRAIALLQQSMPSLRGVEVHVSRTVNVLTLTGTGHVRYEVKGGVFSWFCVPASGNTPDVAGKVFLGDEANGTFTIYFNSIGRLMNEGQRVEGLVTPAQEQILYSVTQRDSLHGEPLYENVAPAQYAWRTIVLTRDGASLWRPVTRDELLGARIAHQQTRIDSVRAGVARAQPLIDTMRARLGTHSPSLPDTARMLPQIRATLRLLESELQALVSARNGMSAADRDLPATVRNPCAPPTTLFVSAANGGRGLVVVSRGLLTRGRPRTEVGMITVEWLWRTDDDAEASFFRHFAERLDLVALRQLLSPP